MRIQSSQIALSSQREQSQTYTLRESLQVRAAPGPPPPAGQRPAPPRDRLDLSDQARTRLATHPVTEPEEQNVRLSPEDMLKILLLRKLFGVVIKLPDELPATAAGAELQAELQAPAPQAVPPQAMSLAYERHESYRESERLRIGASGIIKLADGREIRFDLQAAISRTFLMERRLSVRAGQAPATDPLVINFSGALADLTDRRYAFDLNADGVLEEIPFVGPGSGFLALDRNGDGRISNGRELFGPATGNGFADLAGFDADGNGWIDAGDPIFSSLRLWVRDADGMDYLVPLSRLQIGAIFTGSVDAGFTYKDAQNQARGQQRRASIWIREDGTIGVTQQIDL